jgi:hypothetical protein
MPWRGPARNPAHVIEGLVLREQGGVPARPGSGSGRDWEDGDHGGPGHDGGTVVPAPARAAATAEHVEEIIRTQQSMVPTLSAADLRAAHSYPAALAASSDEMQVRLITAQEARSRETQLPQKVLDAANRAAARS